MAGSSKASASRCTSPTSTCWWRTVSGGETARRTSRSGTVPTKVMGSDGARARTEASTSQSRVA